MPLPLHIISRALRTHILRPLLTFSVNEIRKQFETGMVVGKGTAHIHLGTLQEVSFLVWTIPTSPLIHLLPKFKFEV